MILLDYNPINGEETWKNGQIPFVRTSQNLWRLRAIEGNGIQQLMGDNLENRRSKWIEEHVKFEKL